MRRKLARISLVLVVVCTLFGAAPDSPALPADLVESAIKSDIAYLQKELAKTPNKRALPALKSVAMMLAWNAQSRISSDDKYAAMRDQALKVAEALTDEDVKAAKSAANALSDPPASKDKGILKLSSLNKYEISEAMKTFRTTKSGGLNLEADIQAQSKKTTDVKAVGLIAVRTAALAHFTQDLAPSDISPDKRKKWDKWALESSSLSKEIALEAAKGDKANKGTLEKKLQALDANCAACHNLFKKN